MPDWQLENFLLKFDIWLDRDGPSPDWSAAMMAWIHRRLTDPFEGATYRADIRGWFAVVEDASDETFASCVVYFVTSANKLRCSDIATLRRPVL